MIGIDVTTERYNHFAGATDQEVELVMAMVDWISAIEKRKLECKKVNSSRDFSGQFIENKNREIAR